MAQLKTIPGGISAEQRTLLASALGDAAAWRTPGDQCADCDKSGTGLCLDHADDFALVRAYRELGAELGLEAGS
jgi:hypothetical protein